MSGLSPRNVEPRPAASVGPSDGPGIQRLEVGDDPETSEPVLQARLLGLPGAVVPHPESPVGRSTMGDSP